jgi:alcohol dehydrogenase
MEAVGICGTDWKYYSGGMAGVLADPPHLLGHENVGRIARVGATAARRWGVREGDRVIVESLIPCWACGPCCRGRYNLCEQTHTYGLISSLATPPHLWGGYADYLYLHPHAILHPLAETVPTSQATLFLALANAVRWASRVPGLRAGQTVLIQGPGQQGLGAVVAAREAGAGCIVVCGLAQDARRLEVARALGADHVLVGDREDVVARLGALTGGRLADVVVECSGSPAGQAQTTSFCATGGTIVLGGTSPGQRPAVDLYAVTRRELTVRGVFTHLYDDIEAAIRLLEAGRYPFERLASHELPLEEADYALRLVGRQVPNEDPIHVALRVGAAPPVGGA